MDDTNDLLAVGTQVRCRFYNSRNNEFYGREWETSIDEVDSSHKTMTIKTPYKVIEPSTGYYVWLMQKEILEVLPGKGKITVSE